MGTAGAWIVLGWEIACAQPGGIAPVIAISHWYQRIALPWTPSAGDVGGVAFLPLVRPDLFSRGSGTRGVLLCGAAAKSSVGGSGIDVVRFWRWLLWFRGLAFETLTLPRTVGWAA